MKTLLALRNKKGFTLVELIVVIAIIAVLVAIAVPAMVKYIDNAKEATSQSNCRAVVSAASAVNASLKAGVGKGSFATQVSELLITGGKEDDYGKYGGGEYTINITGAAGAADPLTKDEAIAYKGDSAIHSVEFTPKDGKKVIWYAATSDFNAPSSTPGA